MALDGALLQLAANACLASAGGGGNVDGSRGGQAARVDADAFAGLLLECLALSDSIYGAAAPQAGGGGTPAGAAAGSDYDYPGAVLCCGQGPLRVSPPRLAAPRRACTDSSVLVGAVRRWRHA